MTGVLFHVVAYNTPQGRKIRVIASAGGYEARADVPVASGGLSWETLCEARNEAADNLRRELQALIRRRLKEADAAARALAEWWGDD